MTRLRGALVDVVLTGGTRVAGLTGAEGAADGGRARHAVGAAWVERQAEVTCAARLVDVQAVCAKHTHMPYLGAVSG